MAGWQVAAPEKEQHRCLSIDSYFIYIDLLVFPQPPAALLFTPLHLKIFSSPSSLLKKKSVNDKKYIFSFAPSHLCHLSRSKKPLRKVSFVPFSLDFSTPDRSTFSRVRFIHFFFVGSIPLLTFKGKKRNIPRVFPAPIHSNPMTVKEHVIFVFFTDFNSSTFIYILILDPHSRHALY